MTPPTAGTSLPQNVSSFFTRDGLLSRWHPQFEYRPDQLQMARAVEAAIRDRRHLIVEAGTGTGKTLAYLLPAILSGKRVVISTGTKNLQEQLFYKDLPFLQQHFPRPLRVCYMKGRSNYLCRSKVADAHKLPILDGLAEVSEFQEIARWERETVTGDRGELDSLPEDSRVWPKLDARGERCTGQRCSFFDECFITHMHRVANESDIIIVNHHLFFADLAVKEQEFGVIIPQYGVVVFDEAHEIEETAAQYFGRSVSNLQVTELTRDVRTVLRTKKVAPESALDKAANFLDDSSARFFQFFDGPEGRFSFQSFSGIEQTEEGAYRQLLTALSLLGNTMQRQSEDTVDFLPLFRRARALHENLQLWVESPDREHVHWIERRGRGISLQACPIDVGPILREKLFGQIDTVILTSATLAVSGSFEFISQRVGLEDAATLLLDGGFQYDQQALLYTPCNLPDPRDPAYSSAALEVVEQLLEISQGRAFVLFTSHQQMRLFAETLRKRLPFPQFMQGEAPKRYLLEQFKETPNAVLYATSAFWQGVDVPGDQLSCVIIDKLPFAVPSDPVVAARIQKIRAAGGEAFTEYQVPQAAIALKQGFGRLIRSREDRGVLALLDSRICTKGYGRVFLRSLPGYAHTKRLGDVKRFFSAGQPVA